MDLQKRFAAILIELKQDGGLRPPPKKRLSRPLTPAQERRETRRIRENDEQIIGFSNLVREDYNSSNRRMRRRYYPNGIEPVIDQFTRDQNLRNDPLEYYEARAPRTRRTTRRQTITRTPMAPRSRTSAPPAP